MVTVLCFLPQLPLTNTFYHQHHSYVELLLLFTHFTQFYFQMLAMVHYWVDNLLYDDAGWMCG